MSHISVKRAAFKSCRFRPKRHTKFCLIVAILLIPVSYLPSLSSSSSLQFESRSSSCAIGANPPSPTPLLLEITRPEVDFRRLLLLATAAAAVVEGEVLAAELPLVWLFWVQWFTLWSSRKSSERLSGREMSLGQEIVYKILSKILSLLVCYEKLP
jgi:hypothetical protein